MPAGGVRGDEVATIGRVRVTLLGPFGIELNGRSAGPWYRPRAKRLCELVMLTRSHRLGREVARDLLFPKLAPAASAQALSTALSLAREALAPLGPESACLLRADRANIWVGDEVALDIDAEAHEEALRLALKMEPGAGRDAALGTALGQNAVLLDEEPYAEWAIPPREALELLRQRARLELARDRARGFGRSQPDAVIDAWEDCLGYDPASEEAASALVRVYSSIGQRQLASSTFERCRAALEPMGLAISPALEEAKRSIGQPAVAARTRRRPSEVEGARYGPRDESRLVSVLFAQLSGVSNGRDRKGPEDMKRRVGGALAGAIAEIEGLGGTVTSVSGAGLAAIFGAPETHEDDPERVVRAAFRMLSATGRAGSTDGGGRLSFRVGIETGSAVVGPLWAGGGAGYGAVGAVIEIAAALQMAAKPGSVLVGPLTKAATDGIFEWGPAQEVAADVGTIPIQAVYLGRPKPPRPGSGREAGPARRARLVGRQPELQALGESLHQATLGTGSVVFVVGDPGLGKTRLVQECRRRFMAWVGAGTGRLPLWLEGRCASYASSTPYGVYQQLLSAWIAVSLDEGEDVVRAALERAAKAVFGRDVDHVVFLAHMMGLRPTSSDTDVTQLSPEGLQRATFASVKALLVELTARGPTVLVLEDLHWADPTSLRLTEELADLAGRSSLLVLATRRPEPDPGVSALESALQTGSPGAFRRLELSPLDDDAERELAERILGGDADGQVVQVLRLDVDGNPLFLEERFSSLVETGALLKVGTSWSLSGRPTVDVPQVLERLIRSRVDRLPYLSRQVLIAASVLGPEFSVPVLETVSDVGPALRGAVADLCDSQLIREVRRVPESIFRFRHAVIQEAIYGSLLQNDRSQLHARAAWGTEAASAGRVEEMAAVIGHHFAMAGETERAVHHLAVAGKYAAARFAVDEAVSSYRHAIEIADEDRAGPAASHRVVDLRYQLAEVLWRSSRFDEARETLHEALALVGAEERLHPARLQARLGRVEVDSLRHDAAAIAFDAADELLGDLSGDEDQEWVDVWLEVHVDGRANLYNQLTDCPGRAAAVLARARPVVELRGSATIRASFYTNLANQRARQTRFRIDDETIASARTAVHIAPRGIGDHGAYCLGNLGQYLLWRGDLDEAQENLHAALAISKRTHDRACQAWCLSNLCLVGARRHDVEAVRCFSHQASEAAWDPGNPFTVAATVAARAWLAWKDGRVEDVVRHATAAMARWPKASLVVYYYKGLCLWPMISVQLAYGDIAAAVDAGYELLDPSQVRLPDEVESLIERAKAAWDRGEASTTAGQLSEALGSACELRYA